MTLGLGMGAGVLSAIAADLLQGAVHVSGKAIFMILWPILWGLILRYGPDGWR